MNAFDIPRTGWTESIEALAAMPAFVEAALAEGGDAIHARPREGEFSLAEHACHLRDLEREGYLVRLRRTLTEDRPALDPFDGGAVAALRDYPSQDAQAAARDFAQARREALALVASLGKAELSREANFDGRSLMLCDLVAMMVAHDREHREEIERLIDDLGAS
jgi:hypothetical protein